MEQSLCSVLDLDLQRPTPAGPINITDQKVVSLDLNNNHLSPILDVAVMVSHNYIYS